MIEKFAISVGSAPSEFLGLNHTSKTMILVSLFDSEVRSGHQQRGLANFGIGTLACLRFGLKPDIVIVRLRPGSPPWRGEGGASAV